MVIYDIEIFYIVATLVTNSAVFSVRSALFSEERCMEKK